MSAGLPDVVGQNVDVGKTFMSRQNIWAKPGAISPLRSKNRLHNHTTLYIHPLFKLNITPKCNFALYLHLYVYFTRKSKIGVTNKARKYRRGDIK